VAISLSGNTITAKKSSRNLVQRCAIEAHRTWIVPPYFPHWVNRKLHTNRANLWKRGKINRHPVKKYLKKSLAIAVWFAYLGPVNKSYFTQSEDGSFRPVTFNQSNLADIIADVIGHEFKSALADKVRGLIDDVTK